MTMIGSFLDCLDATSTRLLEEAILEEGASEDTCRLVGMLLELECSRGQAVGHLLMGAITMHCNMQLLRQNALLPSLMLPSALAVEAYQLPFDPLGSSLFGEFLPALLEKVGEDWHPQKDISLLRKQ